MDPEVSGAWLIHHGKKIFGAQNASASYSTIDIAAKSGVLLSRMAASEQFDLSREVVETLGRAGGLSTKTDLPICLRQLEERKVIDIAANGSVSVLGVGSRGALSHTAAIFESNNPEPHERAALRLGELVSDQPNYESHVGEKISDEFSLTKEVSSDLLKQAVQIGFVDTDGDKSKPLLFNGNLFRRDSAAKTLKVLDSLTPAEKSAFISFKDRLNEYGAIHISEVRAALGDLLLSKLRAAAVIDENIVSNETGDHSYVTAPGAFHTFNNPMLDDAFDHAKALVAALSYGMTLSAATRGSIWGVKLLLNKLISGGRVGPAPAIGRDYRALELERVVQIIPSGSSYYMKLLKREVGEIALQVLDHGKATGDAGAELPGMRVAGYTAPETARQRFRALKEVQPTQGQMRGLLSSVRSSGGL